MINFNNFYKEETKKEYFIKLMKFVDNEYKNNICYPEYTNIFKSLELTNMLDLKVVILGQDPYFNKDEAHGLAFSTLSNKLPKSLINIYKEMENDLNIKINQDGNLEYLASQGVLLLNTILTVREKTPLSHKNKGWEEFTLNIIKYINTINKPIVFILWGNNAIIYERYLDNKNHIILKSSHPSPLGAYRSFFGSKPFSKANEFLRKNNINIIKWNK